MGFTEMAVWGFIGSYEGCFLGFVGFYKGRLWLYGVLVEFYNALLGSLEF